MAAGGGRLLGDTQAAAAKRAHSTVRMPWSRTWQLPQQPQLRLTCVHAHFQRRLAAPHRLRRHLALPPCERAAACQRLCVQTPSPTAPLLRMHSKAPRPKHPRGLVTCSCAAGTTHTPLALPGAATPAALIATACSGCSGSLSAPTPAIRRPGLMRVSGPAEQARGGVAAALGSAGGAAGERWAVSRSGSSRRARASGRAAPAASGAALPAAGG